MRRAVIAILVFTIVLAAFPDKSSAQGFGVSVLPIDEPVCLKTDSISGIVDCPRFWRGWFVLFPQSMDESGNWTDFVNLDSDGKLVDSAVLWYSSSGSLGFHFPILVADEDGEDPWDVWLLYKRGFDGPFRMFCLFVPLGENELEQGYQEMHEAGVERIRNHSLDELKNMGFGRVSRSVLVNQCEDPPVPNRLIPGDRDPRERGSRPLNSYR
jgi:hypothetical protein